VLSRLSVDFGPGPSRDRVLLRGILLILEIWQDCCRRVAVANVEWVDCICRSWWMLKRWLMVVRSGWKDRGDLVVMTEISSFAGMVTW
jgi:hypothetical protein